MGCQSFFFGKADDAVSRTKQRFLHRIYHYYSTMIVNRFAGGFPAREHQQLRFDFHADICGKFRAVRYQHCEGYRLSSYICRSVVCKVCERGVKRIADKVSILNAISGLLNTLS